jgi:hypothetical protein
MQGRHPRVIAKQQLPQRCAFAQANELVVPFPHQTKPTISHHQRHPILHQQILDTFFYFPSRHQSTRQTKSVEKPGVWLFFLFLQKKCLTPFFVRACFFKLRKPLLL